MIVFDTESNGFVEDATQIWCIVTYDTETKITSHYAPDAVRDGLQALANADTLICHNLISHDIPLIQKLYPDWEPRGKILDTLVLSQLLYPDRPGGHGLEAWGVRNSIPKPEHEDWSEFTPEMLHRCAEDVRNNYITNKKLLEESYGELQGIPYREVFANSL